MSPKRPLSPKRLSHGVTSRLAPLKREGALLACALLNGLLITLAASTSQAREGVPPSAEVTPTPALSDLHELRVAVSAFGAVQGSFITKPDNEYYSDGPLRYDIPYSGYGGVGGRDRALL